MITTIDFIDKLEEYKDVLERIPYVHEQMMTRYERKVLCILAHKSNQGNGLFEVGCWRGLTTHVLHCVTGQHIWTLDYAVPKDSPGYNPQQGNEVLPLDEIGMECKVHGHPPDSDIDFLIMDSMDFKAEEHNIKNIDFCLVDGNHSYPYIKHDFAEGWKMVRSGGLIVLHDYIHGDIPNPENVEKGIMLTPHDGVNHFIQTMQHLNWIHVLKTNFIYTEKP
jgi:hypothetical protein